MKGGAGVRGGKRSIIFLKQSEERPGEKSLKSLKQNEIIMGSTFKLNYFAGMHLHFISGFFLTLQREMLSVCTKRAASVKAFRMKARFV